MVLQWKDGNIMSTAVGASMTADKVIAVSLDNLSREVVHFMDQFGIVIDNIHALIRWWCLDLVFRLHR